MRPGTGTQRTMQGTTNKDRGIQASSRQRMRLPFALFLTTMLIAACGGDVGSSTSTASTQPGAPASAAPPSTPSTPSTPEQSLAADQPYSDPLSYSSAADASLTAPVAERAAVVHRRLKLNDGSTLTYTGTTGHLTASDANGKAEASVFYVAYTADGKPPGSRPVTFLFNGGPVSATVWLHLGSWGPKRIVTHVPDASTKSFPLVDSPDTLLSDSDLVFIDAIGVGYSEAIAPNTNQTFWGVDEDARLFRDFITRYIAVNKRQTSPKYLYGESYAGIRTPVLANMLETAGVDLAGVVLNSPIMNYNTACDTGYGTDCTGFLPSFGAVSTYYGVSSKPSTTTLPTYIQQLQGFASGSYQPAVKSFLASKTPPSGGVLAQLTGYTGFASQVWLDNFNMDPGTYRSKIKPGYAVDVNDGRLNALTGGAPTSYYDSAFSDQIKTYLPQGLGYSVKTDYSMSAGDTWDWQHDGLPQPDSVPDLASAIAQNPQLKVLVMHGYHDLNCPYFQTEMELGRMGNVPNLRVRLFEGGHMTYLNESSRAPMKTELHTFYNATGTAVR